MPRPSNIGTHIHNITENAEGKKRETPTQTTQTQATKIIIHNGTKKLIAIPKAKNGGIINNLSAE